MTIIEQDDKKNPNISAQMGKLSPVGYFNG